MNLILNYKYFIRYNLTGGPHYPPCCRSTMFQMASSNYHFHAHKDNKSSLSMSIFALFSYVLLLYTLLYRTLNMTNFGFKRNNWLVNFYNKYLCQQIFDTYINELIARYFNKIQVVWTSCQCVNKLSCKHSYFLLHLIHRYF